MGWGSLLARIVRGRTKLDEPTRRGVVGTPTAHDDAMMARALELAQQAAPMGEVPVGAVVYRTSTGEIISRAHNRREIDRDPAAHAELIAMREACAALGDWRLTGCTVVVTLEPCPMCAGLVVNARADRLVYGARDPKAGACESLYEITRDPRLNHAPEVIAGVREDECAAVLRAFFRELRARKRGSGQ